MSLVPIVSYTHIISAVTGLVLAVRLMIAYRRSPTVTVLLFSLFFFSLSLAFFAAAMIGTVTTNPYTINTLNIMNYFFVYIAVALAVIVPFFLSGKRTIGYGLALIVGFFGLVFFFGRLALIEPSVMEVHPPFVYWRPIFPVWLRLMTGIVNMTAAVIFIVSFARLWHRAKTPIVRERSAALVLGMCLFLIASLVTQVISSANFINFILGALLAASAFLVMAHGILHEHGHFHKQQATPL